MEGLKWSECDGLPRWINCVQTESDEMKVGLPEALKSRMAASLHLFSAQPACMHEFSWSGCDELPVWSAGR